MIRKIGVEIEGAWHNFENFSKFEDSGEWRHDGSVDIKPSSECSCEDTGCGECWEHVGEIAFSPTESIDEMIEKLQKYYPDYTNRSCGLHVHFSLSNFDYNFIMWNWKSFYSDYMKFLTSWGTSRKIREGSSFWNRLKNQNHYCETDLDRTRISQQIKGIGRSRYCHVNFAWSKHRTIEIRSCPAFQNQKFSLDFVKSVYDFVNTWLIFTEKKQKTMVLELDL